MPDETLEGWLEREIKDAENTWGMYRSYRQEENIGGVIAVTRLRALKDVSDKLAELWGTRTAGQAPRLAENPMQDHAGTQDQNDHRSNIA